MTPRAAIRLTLALVVLTLPARQSFASLDDVTTYATITGAVPWGIDFDANGNLFVAGTDGGGGKVWKVGPGGSPVTVFATGMTEPHGVVIDASGNVYVADWASPANFLPTRIWKITPAGVKTILVGAITSPYDLVINGSGDLLVSEWGTQDVQKVTMAGVVSNYATGIGGPSDEASSMFYDSATGNLYLGSGPNIRIIGPGGSPVTTFVTGGLGSVNGLDRGPSGEFYVARYSYRNVYVVTPGGAESLYAGSGLLNCADGPRLSAGLSLPNSVLVHNCVLYISDGPCHKIRTIDLPGATPAARSSWGRLKAIYR